MSSFNREDRYIVVKRSDLGKVADHYPVNRFMESLLKVGQYIPKREFLVVESDWPEYEPVWQMIEQRMSGVAPVVERQPLTDNTFIRGWKVGTKYFGIRTEAVEWIQKGYAAEHGEDTKLMPLYFENHSPELAELQANMAKKVVLAVRDACELEPADIDDPECICIKASDLGLILSRHFEGVE